MMMRMTMMRSRRKRSKMMMVRMIMPTMMVKMRMMLMMMHQNSAPALPIDRHQWGLICMVYTTPTPRAPTSAAKPA